MCYGNTRNMMELLGPGGGNYTSHISMSAVPEQPRDGRVSRKSQSNNTLPTMLPTISEDEEVDFEMLYRNCSSPTSSCTSSSCSVDSPQTASYETYSAQLSLSLEQQQQQLEAELNAEEMLLAAIDMRLQQLLELRDQRQAAAALRARLVAPLPAFTAAPQPGWYGPYGQPAQVPAPADAFYWHAAGPAGLEMRTEAACRPAQPGMQQLCAEQSAHQAPARPLNSAGRMAALKLQQLQAAQRMHVALERELMDLLASSF